MASSSTERSRARRAPAAQRTAERSHYARKRRLDLVRLLAPDGRCARCGDGFDLEQLAVDHVDGRLWRVEECSPSIRVARYWREFRAGVTMRALCLACNGQDGGGRRYDVDRRVRSEAPAPASFLDPEASRRGGHRPAPVAEVLEATGRAGTRDVV